LRALPVVILGYYLIGRTNHVMAILWLASASLFFYGWWDMRFVPLILGSIFFNFLLGSHLLKKRQQMGWDRFLLVAGIIANLSLLFLFKYLVFAVESINTFGNMALPVVELELPLGISFFTFLQIAFLVDCWRGQIRGTGFAPYFLFVTFFPHLIAGPLIHHSEMTPQFRHKAIRVGEDIAVGLTIFAIGLFKKLVPAEQMAVWSDSVFNGAAAGIVPTFIESWVGALCFTFQIYFDFSGYTDMAIGLSRMFGIRLPVNFASPYKATSIIEFWRRWHMTLSRFFRDYLYISLGGNRLGVARRYGNLMLVMLLAGLWHGADWKFVLWGALHGIYLMINHGWLNVWRKLGRPELSLPSWLSLGFTFVLVVAAWVPFRADGLDTAMMVLKGMVGGNGVVLPTHYAALLNGALADATRFGITFGPVPAYGGGWQLGWLLACLAFVWLLPNSQEIMRHYEPALGAIVNQPPAGSLARWLTWQPGKRAGVAIGLATAYLCFRAIEGRPGEFIYFQF
jgi:D-alanyl-lipoteichoic acid acyltransferase DltB (MBOAT superfamily)